MERKWKTALFLVLFAAVLTGSFFCLQKSFCPLPAGNRPAGLFGADGFRERGGNFFPGGIAGGIFPHGGSGLHGV